jgi:hypothetical protein
VFIYMGLHKVMDPYAFLKLIRQYDITTTPLVINSIAAALPWFEVICGVLLVLGVAVRGSTLVVLAMLLPFTIIVLKRALAISSAQGISLCAVQFDCGCGGGEVPICGKVIENSGLMLICIWLLTGLGKKLSLRYALFSSSQPSPSPSSESSPAPSLATAPKA